MVVMPDGVRVDQEVTTADFSYDKTRKILYGYSEMFAGEFPRSFSVTSTHTGRTMTFTPVGMDHRLADPDCWDGEAQVYETQDSPVCVHLGHAY